MPQKPAFGGADASAATPLAMMKEGGERGVHHPDQQLLRGGHVPGPASAAPWARSPRCGCWWAVSYLLIRKVISWQIPVAYIGTVAILTLIARARRYRQRAVHAVQRVRRRPDAGCHLYGYRLRHLPVTKPGQIIFGIGCGLLTCFIRRFGSYPEGVCYSILIMNCTTWLLDKYIRPVIYGAPKKEKKEAAK